ncbi:glycosyltransferase family 2 protein [Mucilaginibacter sp. UYCu711]|uniref:glycosyltransferase family 2 protein n=1 Tax=Mucilaginibacter sp. UYCu711 TaxID=3156339 RepID=UPI003D243353
MEKIKISVCIPTFNQCSFLELSIKSAYNQTLPPDEIIVSNDSSTDETKVLLDRLSKEISILRVINQPVNLGMSENTDLCLKAGTGDLIVKLDSDDYLSPLYIEKLSKLLIDNPEAGYAHACVQEIDQDGVFTRERRLARKSGYQTSSDALKAFIKGFRVAANILIYRKEALLKVGYITQKSVNFAEDYYLGASLADAGFGNVYLNEILSYYRVWNDAGQVRQRRKLAEIKGVLKVFEEILEPGYKKRGWNTAILKKKRADFACEHADSLSWKIYTEEEKLELKNELAKFSSSLRARLVASMYLNGFGKILSTFGQLKVSIKSLSRNILLRSQQ